MVFITTYLPYRFVIPIHLYNYYSHMKIPRKFSHLTHIYKPSHIVHSHNMKVFR